MWCSEDEDVFIYRFSSLVSPLYGVPVKDTHQRWRHTWEVERTCDCRIKCQQWQLLQSSQLEKGAGCKGTWMMTHSWYCNNLLELWMTTKANDYWQKNISFKQNYYLWVWAVHAGQYVTTYLLNFLMKKRKWKHSAEKKNMTDVCLEIKTSNRAIKLQLANFLFGWHLP